MNNEIKEILSLLNSSSWSNEAKQIEDYITNLQQENHNLKSQLECYENGVYYSSKVDELQQINNNQAKRNSRQRLANQKQQDLILNLQRENERLKEQAKKDNHILGCNFASKDKYKQRYEDYKSRCKKAIEYNKEIVDNYLEEDDCEYCDGRYATAKHNLNILQKGSDSQ